MQSAEGGWVANRVLIKFVYILLIKIMNKKFFSLILVAVIALTAGWNIYQSKNKLMLSELGLLNVEALANTESGNELECWDSIKTESLSKVFFCGECRYIDNSAKSFWAKKKKCNP
ncbi:hypothetical protein M2137_002421 [Parabacteroides sp. PFB2-10]|uniref:NVEALA domain-containing protein n=1 Tax=Parabacteroides sp. PFB2-10 TaxID=1742405 RepID=UPI002476F808|nr:NVEALA domain-containing protein [Parabacteroides sp. PFB2-10]MDH6313631.1 hypothetical protein [Parabacteroides sp. PFB2-10]MDL2245419.1 NVEALA domain-containing protein [Parabacteroides sp. OttesenSCG-928-J18]